MAADLETLLPSWVYWLKMGVFVLVLVNGTAIRRAGRRLQMDPHDAIHWRSLHWVKLSAP